jgi:hypothetical protein
MPARTVATAAVHHKSNYFVSADNCPWVWQYNPTAAVYEIEVQMLLSTASM